MAEMTRRQNEGSCAAVANGGHAAPGDTACNILSFPAFLKKLEEPGLLDTLGRIGRVTDQKRSDGNMPGRGNEHGPGQSHHLQWGGMSTVRRPPFAAFRPGRKLEGNNFSCPGIVRERVII